MATYTRSLPPAPHQPLPVRVRAYQGPVGVLRVFLIETRQRGLFDLPPQANVVGLAAGRLERELGGAAVARPGACADTTESRAAQPWRSSDVRRRPSHAVHRTAGVRCGAVPARHRRERGSARGSQQTLSHTLAAETPASVATSATRPTGKHQSSEVHFAMQQTQMCHDRRGRS